MQPIMRMTCTYLEGLTQPSATSVTGLNECYRDGIMHVIDFFLCFLLIGGGGLALMRHRNSRGRKPLPILSCFKIANALIDPIEGF